MTPDDVATVRCPACRGPLRWEGSLRRGRLEAGRLRCAGGDHRWPVRGGLPLLVDERAVHLEDRLVRLGYDRLAFVHDPACHYLLPIVQLGSVRALRDAYMRRLELGSLRPSEGGRPLRLLEVGIGCGANLPLIERDLPADLPVELWGLDLSTGMLRQCRRRLRRSRRRSAVRLLQADAHALPFEDHAFDRVFHVGGIASFGDPARALAELGRVARPGTPIVVVDEQLDPAHEKGLYSRVVFRLLTLIITDATAPVDSLPEGARDVVDEQISRFYYCLTFRMAP